MFSAGRRSQSRSASKKKRLLVKAIVRRLPELEDQARSQVNEGDQAIAEVLRERPAAAVGSSRAPV